MNVDINQKIQNLIRRGHQSLESRRPELAIVMFRQALEACPKSLEARKGLRAAQILKFKTEQSGGFGLVVKKFGNIFKVSKARRLIKAGRGIEAMWLAEDLLETDPFDEKYIDVAVAAAKAAGMHEAAAITIEAAYSSGGGNAALLEKVALYYSIAKNWTKVKEAYSKLLAAKPGDQRLLRLLKNADANLTLSSGWEQTAGKQGGTMDLLANPEQAAELDRQNAANVAEDDVDKAARIYLSRISVNKEDINAYRALARLYLKSKRYEEAVDTIEKAIAVSKSDPEMERMLSSAKLSKYDADIKVAQDSNDEETANRLIGERYKFMFTDLKERVMRYPNDLHLRYELGALYCKYDQYDEAIEHLQLSQKSPKDRLESLYLLALCFIKKGQTDLGVMQLETAMSQLPTMDELKKKVVYRLGRCAEDEGNLEKAYSYYRDVYSADIGFEDLNDRMLHLGKILKEKKNA